MAATAAHVVTVDAFEGDIFTGFASTEDRARQEIAKSGLAHKITIDKASHQGYRPQDMFGMVFIDGAHDLDSVLRDIATCRPALTSGGIMAFHDANMASVKQGMRGIELAGFQLGGEVDTLRWYYK